MKKALIKKFEKSNFAEKNDEIILCPVTQSIKHTKHLLSIAVDVQSRLKFKK